jgi:hypothetical protein
MYKRDRSMTSQGRSQPKVSRFETLRPIVIKIFNVALIGLAFVGTHALTGASNTSTQALPITQKFVGTFKIKVDQTKSIEFFNTMHLRVMSTQTKCLLEANTQAAFPYRAVVGRKGITLVVTFAVVKSTNTLWTAPLKLGFKLLLSNKTSDLDDYVSRLSEIPGLLNTQRLQIGLQPGAFRLPFVFSDAKKMCWFGEITVPSFRFPQ